MNYQDLAKEIIDKIKQDNIESLSHCATRLRFVLKDNSVVDKDQIKAIKGVLNVMESGGQFQVIIGMTVPQVYEEVMKIIGYKQKEGVKDKKNEENKEGKKNKKEERGKLFLKALNKVFDFITGSLNPLIAVLAGAGILKGLVLLFVFLGWLDDSSGTYYILQATSNSLFYFLPVILGFSAANKLGANPFMGAVIGASLLEPNYAGLIAQGVAETTFLGIPIFVLDYSSSVLPIMFAVVMLSFLEKFLEKVVPSSLKIFFVPMICLVIIVPLTITIFGPFGIYISKFIGNIFTVLFAISPAITGFVFGAIWFLLVIFGLHWGIIPIGLLNYSLYGYDGVLPTMAISSYAQMGVALAVFLKNKEVNSRAITSSAFLTGFLTGVTEPIIYGVILKYRRTIIPTLIAGGVGGALVASFQIKQYAFAMAGVLGLPSFVSDKFLIYLVIITGVLLLAMLLTFIIGYEDKKAIRKEVSE